MVREGDLHIFTCKACGKQIISLYDKQFKQNVDAHKRSCKGVMKHGK